MLQGLYDWTMRMAAHRRAMSWLFVVSFIESSVFPIPPDVMIVPMVLADRSKAFRVALVSTLGSVLGALAGYAIGAILYEAVARPLIEFYGYGEAFREFTVRYNEWGAWIVAVAAVTPFPFKVITIASGAVGLNLAVFVVAALVARGARFLLEAALLWRFGPPIRGFIEGNLKLVTSAFLCLLIGGFVMIRYLA